jgi:NAD(P)-dependent dehydrogenase (short-subunit alcohol dehydrogenase family)
MGLKKIMNVKHYLIVGGSKGLGAVLTRELLAKGNEVTIVSRSLGELSQTPGLYFIKLDLSNEDEVEGFCRTETMPAWDGLIFCQRFRETAKQNDSANEWRVSVESTRHIVETAACLAKPQAAIVMIGSEASRQIVSDQGPSYHIAKAALEQIVRYYAVALGKKGIRINMAAPCAFENDYPWSAERCGIMDDLSPLNTHLKCEDVIELIKFLLSPTSRCLTGQTIVLDGGISLQSANAVLNNYLNK